MKILTRKYFNLPADPWAQLQLATADAWRVADMVDAAITAQALVSILGPRGSGKSHAISATLAEYEGLQLVEPLRLDRDRLTMNDIASAIVRDCSDETPKHSGEGRAYQVQRLLGESKASVLLLIDDAHALHGQTLRALKRLRELPWHGKSPLLGIVLVGQRDKTSAIPEVGLRSDHLWLGGLTKKESETALEQLQPAPFAAGAIEKIATAPAARNWLDLQALVDDCLLVAQADGQCSVSPRHVALALDPSSATTPKSNAPSDAQVSDYLANKLASEDASSRRVANG